MSRRYTATSEKFDPNDRRGSISGEITRGIIMNKSILAATAALTVLLATGCTSGIKDDISALQSRVDVLEQEVAANKAAAANSTAALGIAENAQVTADEALALAAVAIDGNAATNEKVDRMFQRSQSK
jgi:hypothetical protein